MYVHRLLTPCMQLYMIYMSTCVYINVEYISCFVSKERAHAQCSGNSRDSNLIIYCMRDKLWRIKQNRKRQRAYVTKSMVATLRASSMYMHGVGRETIIYRLRLHRCKARNQYHCQWNMHHHQLGRITCSTLYQQLRSIVGSQNQTGISDYIDLARLNRSKPDWQSNY